MLVIQTFAQDFWSWSCFIDILTRNSETIAGSLTQLPYPSTNTPQVSSAK